ncbi:MAG: hypothetical protein HY556_02085 [Euryarchaeota archaeon]|nr:hypothetical protein [Euryarchaeota archaeon]
MESNTDEAKPLAIAMMDILGFGNSFRRHGPTRMAHLYKRLIALTDEQAEGGLVIKPVPNGKGSFNPAIGWFHPQHTQFSDTILFWVPWNPISLSCLTELCAEAVCSALEIGLALRGAITIGLAEMDNEERLYLGEPLIEAAETEKAQEWIGISFGPSIAKTPYNRGLYLDGLTAYKSHVKPGKEAAVPGLVVDWPRRWRDSRKENVGDLLRRLDDDPLFSTYYNRTLDFLTFSAQNENWFHRRTNLPPG